MVTANSGRSGVGDTDSMWAFRGDRDIYVSRLSAWLETDEIRGQVGPSYGRRAQSVRDVMLHDAYVQRALGQSRSRSAYDALRRRAMVLHAALNDLEEQARGVALEWRWMLLVGSTALLLRCLLVGASWMSFAGVGLLIATGVVVTCRRPESVASLRQLWRVLCVLARAANAWPEYNKARQAWRKAMATAAVPEVLRQVARAAFVTESDLAVRAEDTEGLRAATDRSYVVLRAAEAELRRKMAQMDGGTIALCGVRGSGKSTLIDGALGQATLGVRTHTPTSYAPHDFLLSLFVDVCERYIVMRGYPVPVFRHLGRIRLSWSRLPEPLRRASALCALPAVALLAVTMSVGVSDLSRQYGTEIGTVLARVKDAVVRDVGWAWGAGRVVVAMATATTGLLCWRLRQRRWFRPALGLLWRWGWQSAGALLIVLSLGTVFTDEDIARLLDTLGTSNSAGLRHALVFGLLAWVSQGAEFRVSAAVTVTWLTEVWRRLMEICHRFCQFGFAASLLADDTCRAILLDDDNPGRLAMALCGLCLMSVPDLRMRPVPELVTECRNQLLHLRTVQTSSTGWNAGIPFTVASLGAQYGTSLSTIPPNFAELVRDFRDLLSRIAWELHDQKGRCVIAVDELDRLGSDAVTIAFLNEIKAIFGVPHVHFVVTVADDVGATFVRRGLPHRDATDSTLDDVVYVQPCLVDESHALLTARVPGLTERHVLLVHALAGGLPRDLIRYARRVIDLHLSSGVGSLVGAARRLILEELSEVITGFRVLLAGQPDPESDTNGSLIGALRDLTVGLRRMDRAPTPDLDEALKAFAFEGRIAAQHSAVPLSDTTAQLITEASAFAYFSLTLLDVFAAADFPRRRALAAARGYAGDPALFAEARQELSVSAFSARLLITAIRHAWQLPVPETEDRRH